VKNLNKNLLLVEKPREQTRTRSVTVAQLAIAEYGRREKTLRPVGARKCDRLDEFLGTTLAG
jgi:hypothetical protein